MRALALIAACAIVGAMFASIAIGAPPITPTQKDDPVPVVQKGTPTPTQTTATPTQKDPVVTPTQKDPYIGPTQKGTFAGPTQKGGVSAYELAEVPRDLLDRLRALERQPCQPVRNLGRALARCVIKKRIGRAIEDHLPPGPPLP